MTPQEKGKEVFEKLVTGTNERSLIIAKKHSLILVDEIIKVFYFINPNSEDLILLEELNYWKEVRNEIQLYKNNKINLIKPR
jgi:hypothetical protein